jgi:hypothetical protein
MYMKPIDRIQEDWEMTKQRYTNWWTQELVDRALVQVTAPKSGVKRNEWLGGILTPETAWTNIDYMIWRMLEDIRTTDYGGEALPLFYHNWSAGHALVMGCEPQFAPDTVWTDPIPVDEDGYPPIHFLKEGRWWQWMRDCTLRAAQASQGRYFVLPVWGNHAGDNLALLRGSEALMADIVENPGWVRQAARKVSDILNEVYTDLWALVGENITGIEGSVNYCNTWSPGKTMGFDTDISCMLSPKQFEQFFLPPLIETMRTVDHRIYHLDGTVALQHLDLLLSVPEIHAIQWVPGAGREAILQWVPLIRRIQQAGKSILVYTTPQEIPPLLGEVSACGLCIGTTCASEQEARDLLDVVKRLSKKSS